MAGADLTTSRTYPPGWLDRLTDRVRKLPGPAWSYYLGLFVLQFAYVNVVLWFEGREPFGSIDTTRTFFVVTAPYLLWARFLLDQVADRALQTFRPALRVGDAEVARLRYELTTLPARQASIVTGVGLVFALWGMTHVPSSMIEEFASSLEAALIKLGPLMAFAIVTVFVATYQAIHQLRMVARVHAQASEIKLFKTRPLYAFSKLTAATGISFLALAYGFVAFRSEAALGTSVGRVLLVAVVLTAIACFVLPLRGMHLQLAAEKARLLAAANDRLVTVIARLHQRVDDDVLSDADKLNTQLASLVTERDTLAKISTWPWEPATLTAFVSTLLVPALLMLLPRFLESLRF